MGKTLYGTRDILKKHQGQLGIIIHGSSERFSNRLIYEAKIEMRNGTTMEDFTNTFNSLSDSEGLITVAYKGLDSKTLSRVYGFYLGGLEDGLKLPETISEINESILRPSSRNK